MITGIGPSRSQMSDSYGRQLTFAESSENESLENQSPFSAKSIQFRDVVRTVLQTLTTTLNRCVEVVQR